MQCVKCDKVICCACKIIGNIQMSNKNYFQHEYFGSLFPDLFRKFFKKLISKIYKSITTRSSSEKPCILEASKCTVGI